MEVNATDFYCQFERKFVNWAESVNDIRAAFIIGSRARNDHPADEWSDLDIVLFTLNQHFYLTNCEWLENMGNVLNTFAYQTSGGDPERLTLFEGGWQVDFVIHTYDSLKQIVDSKSIPNNFYRGVKVIIDKDNIASNIMPKQFVAPHCITITENAFKQIVNMFLFTALYTAKQILRNELWIAKTRDATIKELLLQIIEWHEKAVNGNNYDTWHAGRFLCEWTSEDIQKDLEDTFGHFNRVDSWKALLATLNLFQRLSHDISQKMNFSYPYELEKYIYSWINEKTGKIMA